MRIGDVDLRELLSRSELILIYRQARCSRPLVQAVVGVDVHPLAVIIARATFALAIADLIPASAEAVTLPVYLANSLETVEMVEVLTLWGEHEVNLVVGAGDYAKVFPVPTAFIRNVSVFDRA